MLLVVFSQQSCVAIGMEMPVYGSTKLAQTESMGYPG